MSDSVDVRDNLRSAFPAAVVSHVDATVAVLDPGALRLPAPRIERVIVNGETLRMPSRIYGPEPSPADFARLPERAQTVLACIYTRHHDGHVRERNLRLLLPLREPWVTPYVLHLAGEYVSEIIQVALQHLESLRCEQLARFAAENPVFIQKIRCRLITYWSTYYRTKFPVFRDYPGYRFMSGLGLWNGPEAHWLLRRQSRA